MKLVEEESYIIYGERNQLHACCICDDEEVFEVCRRIKENTGIGLRFGSVLVSYPAKVLNRYERSKKSFFSQKTTRARLVLAVDNIRVGSSFQFDYFCLLLTASVLAAIGLASNNAVVIVASMLVSPIMNPVRDDGWCLIV